MARRGKHHKSLPWQGHLMDEEMGWHQEATNGICWGRHGDCQAPTQPFKSSRKVHKWLVQRYEDPFPIVKRVGKVAYQIQFLPRLKNSLCLPCKSPEALSWRLGRSKQVWVQARPYYGCHWLRQVEYILADRVICKRGVRSYTEYLVRWKDHSENEVMWELEDFLWQFADAIWQYKEETTPRMSRDQMGEVLRPAQTAAQPSAQWIRKCTHALGSHQARTLPNCGKSPEARVEKSPSSGQTLECARKIWKLRESFSKLHQVLESSSKCLRSSYQPRRT